MAVGMASQLFQGVTATNRFNQTNKFRSLEKRHSLPFPSTSFPSVAYAQDSLVHNVSERTYRPVLYVPSRYRAMGARSFALPVPWQEIPLVNSTSSALARSCDTLLTNPATSLVVPAIGIILFALWGFMPLMKEIRNHFDHGGNWKQSPTYVISSSYIQPLLLWTGATLICRGLDPVVLPSAASRAVKIRLVAFVRSLSTVLAIAYILTSLIQQIFVSCFVKTTHLEEYLNVQEDVLLDFLRIVGHHRARLATQTRTVQKSYGNADIDNIPFGEEMYNRVRGRPLLIDTSAKISEGKSKSRSASREEHKFKTSASVETKSASHDSPSLSNSDKKEHKKVVTEDDLMADIKNDHVTSRTPSPSTENVDPVSSTSMSGKGEPRGSEITERQGDGSVSLANPKKESRPALEDNIVLGVALEGSKRTLPIEEGIDPHLPETEPDTVEVGSSPKDKKGQSHTL